MSNTAKALSLARQMQRLIAESPALDSSELTDKEYPYSMPFAADKMEPCKWLYRVYLDPAIEHLEREDLSLFTSIEGFSFYFTHSYAQTKEADVKKLCLLLVEFEEELLTLQK